MISFLRDIAASVLFRNRLSAIGGDKNTVDDADFEKITKVFELNPGEESILVQFQREISDRYISPAETRDLFIPILEGAAERGNHKSAYGTFKALFGDFVDWKEFFPDIEERRQAVETDILSTLASGVRSSWGHPLYFDTNKTLNAWLADVGSDNRGYAFVLGGSVCYLYGPAEHWYFGINRKDGQKEEYNVVTFKTFTSKGCSSFEFEFGKADDIEKYKKDGVYDGRSTIAVFEPTLAKKLHRHTDAIGGLFFRSAVLFVKLHEVGHAVLSDRDLNNLMRQLPQISDDPDITQMYDIYAAGEETIADISALRRNWIGTFAYWLKGFPKHGLTECMLRSGKGISPTGYQEAFEKVRTFYKGYYHALKGFIHHTKTSNDGITATSRAVENVSSLGFIGGSSFDTLDEKIQADLVFIEFSEIFWRNKAYIRKLKPLIREKAREFNKLKRNLCGAKANDFSP